ncbi:MAG: potassium transporter TrkG [Pseudomonadota bacterium]
MLKGAQSSLLFWSLLVVTIAMFIPMLLAAGEEDWRVARTFMYYGLFCAIMLYIYGLALGANPKTRKSGAALLDATLVFVCVPIAAAAPVVELYPNLGWRIVIFDMVSAFTTTGASRLAGIEPISDVVQLWRGLVAWLGGYYFIVVAYSVLGPLRINGCDTREDGTPLSTNAGYIGSYDASRKAIIRRFNRRVVPIYMGATGTLFVALVISGQEALPAAMAAMATLSTSGILLEGTAMPFLSEALIFIFLGMALSRFTFGGDRMSFTQIGRLTNPEFKLALVILASVTIFMVARHYIAAWDAEASTGIVELWRATWGTLFTALSFLTTAGFVSEHWAAAQNWSDFSSAELVLMSLAICGGGVATTAGGVKLLRIYTLAQHSVREMKKLSLPSAVDISFGVAGANRRLVLNAWVVVMLFALSIGIFSVIFTLLGQQFEDALVLTIAGLSTTGPLLSEAVIGRDMIVTLSGTDLFFLELAMIVGRLETLAVLALFNPILWQGRAPELRQRLA